MGIKLVSEPSEEPVTLEEAKKHLRVDISDDDSLITSLIMAAREHAEAITRRALITQTWELSLDIWPYGSEIIIPLPPLQKVDSIKYTDSAGVEHMLDLNICIIDTKEEPGRIVLKNEYSWPSETLQAADAVHIRFTAGYGNAGNVPQTIKQAILLMIGWWYEQRETAIIGSVAREVPMAAEALLWPYRVLRWL
ncbi:head-tail connector protein [Mahella australiensis]|uniref:Phage gp6-like head-tail connector protein n=1 Tax=Mahella australiensis (strain DSM 15567 / CIP 107919 / 50-1 BON) TaxID=697281 RepID=F4A0H0_MAHA5|nr:head-tail connector protein [Mahella australiensis]AEE98031.1 phiE125 gp8 hypothetical protein [Mahella australiensis 50-1 BON]